MRWYWKTTRFSFTYIHILSSAASTKLLPLWSVDPHQILRLRCKQRRSIYNPKLLTGSALLPSQFLLSINTAYQLKPRLHMSANRHIVTVPLLHCTLFPCVPYPNAFVPFSSIWLLCKVIYLLSYTLFYSRILSKSHASTLYIWKSSHRWSGPNKRILTNWGDCYFFLRAFSNHNTDFLKLVLSPHRNQFNERFWAHSNGLSWLKVVYEAVWGIETIFGVIFSNLHRIHSLSGFSENLILLELFDVPRLTQCTHVCLQCLQCLQLFRKTARRSNNLRGNRKITCSLRGKAFSF